MKKILKRLILFVGLLNIFYCLFAQNTPPSCVITMPHCNAYFEQGTAVNIRVYATDLGGTYTGGSVVKVEFFKDDIKLGESSIPESNTYSYTWTDVPEGTYRITAKATDNEDTVFTSAGVIITVGSSPVTATGLSANKGKYIANINGYNRTDYLIYWNGVTAENSCKWGSVEATRDYMNWVNADKTYNFARDNHISFRYHTIVWGSQYPSWITTLSPEDFQAEVEEYMAAIAERYPLIDQIDVLNENMHLNSYNQQEHSTGMPYFRAGLGGPGVTGYDWAIWLFEKARYYFPNAKLVMNDFELETNTAGLNEMLAVIKVLRDRGLIDGIGTQAHYFSIDNISKTTLQNALNNMANSGVPIYVTEMDMKGSSSNEATQLSSYQNAFPVYWNHPAVAGITLWGYVDGQTWSTGTGLLTNTGTEKSAMTWLKTYVDDQPNVGYPFYDGSGITSSKIVETENNLSIYPNPVTSGKITVEYNTGEIIDFIQIFDMQGKIVKTINPCEVKVEINLSNLNKGIYYLKAQSEKIVSNYKIIIP